MPKKNDSNSIVPIYIKSLEIENIRCFGSKQVLNLLKPDGTLAQWTILLGDNGVGKTTLLQCLAWMSPVGRYSKAGNPVGVMPALLEEENYRLLSLVRSTKANKAITSIMRAKFCEDELKEKVQSYKINKRTGLNLVSKKGMLEEANPISNSKTFDPDINLITYSASRILGEANLENPKLSNPRGSIFDESAELYDPEEILIALDYASKIDNEGLPAKLLKKIKEMLVAILPDLKSADDIKVLGSRVFKNLGDDARNVRKGGVRFTMPYGKVPYDNLSLGYKTSLSWTVDLAWRLSFKYPDSDNPMNGPAIVLIDEIDLHLHPLWQRSIMKCLSEHFPRVQFIATSHSPFMIQAAYDSNYAVLNKTKDEVLIKNDPIVVDGWRIDQIATSELIGVPTARGENYEKIYDERKKLLGKSRLKKEEEEILKALDKEIAELPTGETPEEIEARWFIQNAAEESRKSRKIKIDKN